MNRYEENTLSHIGITWSEELEEVEAYLYEVEDNAVRMNLETLFTQQNSIIRRLKEIETMLMRMMQK